MVMQMSEPIKSISVFFGEDNLLYPRKIEVMILAIDYLQWVRSLREDERLPIILVHVSTKELIIERQSKTKFTLTMFDRSIIYVEATYTNEDRTEAAFNGIDYYAMIVDHLINELIHILKEKITGETQ